MKQFFANLIFKFLVKPWLTLIIGVRYVNQHVFDDLDQCIIVANHNSHFDLVSIMAALPISLRSKTSAVATQDYFGKSSATIRIMQFFFNAILINRKRVKGGPSAIDIMDANLKNGQSMVIFPEGSRGKAGELAEFKSGVAVLLSKNPSIPFVPVYLNGFGRVLPKKKFLILPMITKLRFGAPQFPKSDTVADILQEVEEAVLSLKDAHDRDRNKFMIK